MYVVHVYIVVHSCILDLRATFTEDVFLCEITLTALCFLVVIPAVLFRQFVLVA